mmetsp:Transcript_39003/g.107392  ORF Transcript_39003/g.107392 Transcript_39003/m.107392 type:complete len:170 (-) Transcript_39003:128-637(-)
MRGAMELPWFTQCAWLLLFGSKVPEVAALSECRCTRENPYGDNQRVLTLPADLHATVCADEVAYLCICLHTRVEVGQDAVLTSFDGSTFRYARAASSSQVTLAARREICGMSMGSEECDRCTLADPWTNGCRRANLSLVEGAECFSGCARRSSAVACCAALVLYVLLHR